MSSIPESALPTGVLELCAQLQRAGFRAWIVGGCVRDLLMGKPVSDWDFATDARPEQVQRVFRRTVPTGLAHGTVTVLLQGGSYEVTTLRGEGAYRDGRRPESVHFTADIDEDLARRDFTVNAIAYSPTERALVDPWHGQRDIAARIVRAVRDPRERFGEDGLRVLRAARFVATLDFDLDPETEAAIGPTLDTFRKVSAERVRAEWAKLLANARRPSRGFEIMRRTGMLAISAPSLDALDEKAFACAMRRVDAAPSSVVVRIAALMLETGGDLDGWLRALRFSNEERQRVLRLVEASRSGPGSASQTDLDLGARRFLHRVGLDAWRDALASMRADRIARDASLQDLDRLAQQIESELARGAAVSVADLAIDGSDVMRALGGKPGRYVGRVLDALLERVLEDPSLNVRETLIAIVPEVAQAIGMPGGGKSS